MKSYLFILIASFSMCICCMSCNKKNNKEVIKSVDEVFTYNIDFYRMLSDNNLKEASWCIDTVEQKKLILNFELFRILKRHYIPLINAINIYKDKLYSLPFDEIDHKEFQNNILTNQSSLNKVNDSISTLLSANITQLHYNQYTRTVNFGAFHTNSGDISLFIFYLTSIQFANTEILYWWSLYLFEDLKKRCDCE